MSNYKKSYKNRRKIIVQPIYSSPVRKFGSGSFEYRDKKLTWNDFYLMMHKKS